ncbi:MAG TPA: lipopolysaccharide kinase InaA family protein [Phycisphaerae bacterium]|nr:lipopolysaccharide kinase InaA family protein [Phycisphaerae bacterium]
MKTLFHCEPEYVAPLRAAGLLDFDFLMNVRGGPPSSVHAYRETVPLEILVDDRPRKFYLKRVFKIPGKHSVAPLFRRRPNWSQPRREWEILAILAEAGIPAMKRVAYGERRRMGLPVQALLLVEAVPMPFTLENWLVPGFPRPIELPVALRHRLTNDLGRLVGLLHTSGFSWPDIHPKHIFARPPDENKSSRHWEFCLIDVERMEGGGGLEGPLFEFTASYVPNDKRAFDDCRTFFNALRPLQVTSADIRRFWAGYCYLLRHMYRKEVRSRPYASQPMPNLIELESLPRLPDDYEHPHAAPLERRDQIQIDPQAASSLGRLGLRAIDDVFAYRGGQDLGKPGLAAFRERSRIELSEGNGCAKAYYLKRYDSPPLADQLRRIQEFRPSRSTAAREVHFIKRLAQIGIPTLRTIAYGQEMAGIWERRSFVVTAELAGQSLEKLVAQGTADPALLPAPAERREIIRQLGLIVRLMHAEGLYHRDLYLAHVFLSRNADGQIVLRLIDLARMIENPWNPHRWAVKDLAALAYSSPSPLVTRADRLRFLYHYLGDRGKEEKKNEARHYVIAVDAKVRRIARHDRKRRRQLMGTTA